MCVSRWDFSLRFEVGAILHSLLLPRTFVVLHCALPYLLGLAAPVGASRTLHKVAETSLGQYLIVLMIVYKKRRKPKKKGMWEAEVVMYQLLPG